MDSQHHNGQINNKSFIAASEPNSPFQPSSSPELSRCSPPSFNDLMMKSRAAVSTADRSQASRERFELSNAVHVNPSFAIKDVTLSMKHLHMTGISNRPTITTIHRSSSKCPERPCYLVSTHFYTFQDTYETIETIIENSVKGLLGEHSEELDYRYFSDDKQWRMKYMNGSDCREIHINVYWDSNANDHIIEINRVKGDGMFPALNSFFDNLRQSIQGSNYVPESNSKKPRMVGYRMPGPPPLHGRIAVPLSNEMFLRGIQPILSMAADQFYEPRLEAAKSFCDLAQRSEQLLSIPECKEGVVSALNNLLMDEFDDVKQFAVMACSLFAQLPSYKQSLSRMPQLRVLAELVLEGPADESVSFETAQMRRRACLALTLIAEKESEAVCECLKEQNVRSLEAWRSYVSKMDDPRLVDHANKLELCIVY